ncbi:MAG: alpha/beta fold hydrolase [Acidimicrobiia bacterium]|nr:alpha/beta fold hydrolase [Acidimicrobiia bacterium]
MLLHGLISTGDIYGSAFDDLANDRIVITPDLLGFGHSLSHTRTQFTLGDHLDALDALVDATDAADRPIRIGAHSMGSAVALAWAKRHPNRVESVLCWGAPMQRSRQSAIEHLSGSAMASLFALNTNLARQACAISCRHRETAGWFAALADPRLPIPIARAVPLHTWPAYRDALEHLVLDVDWSGLVEHASDNDIPVEFMRGNHDNTADQVFVDDLLGIWPITTHEVVPAADHRLPLTHPVLCRSRLSRRSPVRES